MRTPKNSQVLERTRLAGLNGEQLAAIFIIAFQTDMRTSETLSMGAEAA